MEEKAGPQIKAANEAAAKAKMDAAANPTKTQAAAENDALPLSEAGGAPIEAGDNAEADKLAGGAPAAPKAALSSNKASLTAASMLAQICERAFMEHQLAARHFTFYSFCKSMRPSVCDVHLIPTALKAPLREPSPLCAGVFFIPLNLLIATTSILAFIAGESSVSNDNNVFNILVGCLAAFGVFWNSCDRMLNYKSRADMHTGAKMLCKELLADLDFTLIKFHSLSDEERKDKANDPMSPEDLADIKTKLDQVQESCTSAVPDAINQVFKQVNTMVVFDLGIQGMADGSGENLQLVRLANVLLCKEITKSWTWPMQLPGEAICKKARDALRKEYKTEPTDLSEMRKVKEQQEAEDKKQRAAAA